MKYQQMYFEATKSLFFRIIFCSGLHIGAAYAFGNPLWIVVFISLILAQIELISNFEKFFSPTMSNLLAFLVNVFLLGIVYILK